jgi:hypothetical protein
MMPAWVWPVGAVLAIGCGNGDSSGPSPGPGPGPEMGPVRVADNFFQPASVTVTRVDGTARVDWNWTGSNQHNVTFDAGPPNSETDRLRIERAGDDPRRRRLHAAGV